MRNAPTKRQIAIDNGHAPAYVGLASVYERVNREADLEPLRARDRGGIDGPPIDFIDALRLKRARAATTMRWLR
jgi:hypothetical protein